VDDLALRMSSAIDRWTGFAELTVADVATLKTWVWPRLNQARAVRKRGRTADLDRDLAECPSCRGLSARLSGFEGSGGNQVLFSTSEQRASSFKVSAPSSTISAVTGPWPVARGGVFAVPGLDFLVPCETGLSRLSAHKPCRAQHLLF